MTKITRIENVKEGTGVKREGNPGTLTLRCDKPLHKSGHMWWSAGFYGLKQAAAKANG